ncbi:hypothetical protein NE237_013694 [Protea cynaroides]|uniref:Uncharacterized protein n=1 Tax=Protea cynaroides TaxID=273540 RepID=A0A9Q0JYT1_9MAGN|nr:hypothetical protein NE237_013694 [Protea cynaroides]
MKPGAAESIPEADGAQTQLEKSSLENLSKEKKKDNPVENQEGRPVLEKLDNASGKGIEQRWYPVRARKKRSTGFRARTPTRPIPCLGRSDGGSSDEAQVSKGHWVAPVLPETDQVTQSEPCSFKEIFSNSKACPLSVDCPPNPFECLNSDIDHSSVSDGLLEPINKEKSAPLTSGSSASHTPYLNRVSCLAREKRLGQARKIGPSRPSMPSGLVVGPSSGPVHSLPTFSILKSLSCSRGKSVTGGADSRNPEILLSPSPVVNLGGCVDGSIVCPNPPWEGDDILSPMSEVLIVEDNPNLKLLSKELELSSIGKERMEEDGRDLAHQNP